jgi:arylsulfatase A-like enzyme
MTMRPFFHPRGVLCIAVIGLLAMTDAPDQTPTDAKLRARAIQETAVPVRPGAPGERPFWNEKAVQFQYAPAFDFKEVSGAKSYRFTVVPARGETVSFTADKPWAPLSLIWTRVITGKAKLAVQGLDAQGAAVGEPMTRAFHRAAVIGREYPPPAMPWGDSARTALDALAHSPDLRCWFTTGVPDPEIHLYRYPSKIIGAAAAVLAAYAAQTPAPADAAEALQAARRAADYLIGLGFPADAAWAFHPPTYHPTMFRERMKGHMDPANYMTSCGAETGSYYLDVYAATKDAKYLAAAVRIAETYARQQRADGSWLLFVTPKDGKPVTGNVMIPTLVIELLDQLARVTGDRRFDAVRDKAVAWTMRNPARTWNWQGQFEDVKPLPPYENLTKHEAGDFAIHLLQTAANDPEKRALALDLLRFAEDQFVMWAQPPVASPKNQNPDGEAGAKSKQWMMPCVLEQYRCYSPVCASSAKLIHMYLAAHRATGDRLHLEKARALAGTLTRAQSNPKAPGRYQTWLMQNPGPMWFNCELLAIRAMQELAAADSAAPANRPNILVILADDVGYGDLGVHGGKDVPTPHIDALAAAGVRFTSGYVSAPLCGPSRAGFISGRYQTRFGFEHNPRVGDENKLGLPLDQRTIADHLRAAGYATGVVGKWHLGFSPAHVPQSRGFDDYFGFLVAMHNFILSENAESKFEAAYSRNMIYRGRELQKLNGYTTDVFTDEALGFMKRQAGKPWFLYLAYNAVHTPLEILQKYGDRVPASITDPERRGYLSLLIGLDDNVGRITAHLRETGLDKNTLVFFFSDNGGAGRKPFLSYNTANNAPLRGDKGQLLEGGIRVPFFVSWPGKLPAGKSYDQPVISLDIAATAASVADDLTRSVRTTFDGVNLLPFLTGENTGSPHDALYWRLGPQKAVRRGNWKLVDWRDFRTKTQSGWQLFDLSQDIAESNDLAAKHPDLVAELSQAWKQWDAKNISPLWHGSSTEDPTAPEIRAKKKNK